MKHCRGKISDGEKVYRGRRLWELAYLVFQDVNHQLFSESVKEEVTLGLPLSEGKKEELAGQVLRQMGLLDYKDCHPMSLSGGQKQRLAVAGAMASGKDLIVYGEPTSGLDYRHMEIVADMINDLSEKGKTQFIITHDPELVEPSSAESAAGAAGAEEGAAVSSSVLADSAGAAELEAPPPQAARLSTITIDRRSAISFFIWVTSFP